MRVAGLAPLAAHAPSADPRAAPALFADVSPLEVVLSRGPHGWWVAELGALAAQGVGQGPAGAIRALAAEARRRARAILGGWADDRERYLAAALWVTRADEEGRLEAALEEAAVLDEERSLLPSR